MIDRPYTDYYDSAQWNNIVQVGTLNCINQHMAKNDRQILQDNLFGIYKTNVIYTPTSNTISIIEGGTGISDYFHLLNLKAKYIIPYTDNSIIGATNATPIVIELLKPLGIQSGVMVVISGVTGNTNANGQRYVKRITPTRYALYSDVNLLTPVAANANYISGGTISRVFYEWNFATSLKPNRKFSELNKATVDAPMTEIANSMIKIYPLTWSCSEITVDYLSIPVYIDVDDSSTDLHSIYSQDFINDIANECARLVGKYTRDFTLEQGATIEMQQP